jgi:lauroyl/myristoyl acyltransferase
MPRCACEFVQSWSSKRSRGNLPLSNYFHFPPDGRVETAGIEHLDRAIATGRPAIIFGGHLGNWEVAALAAGQYGIDVAQIYRAANNPLVERMIARFRGTASEFIPKGRIASRRIFIRLRKGVRYDLSWTAAAEELLRLHFQ